MTDESLFTIDRRLRSLLPTGVGLRIVSGTDTALPVASPFPSSKKRKQELRAGRVCAVQALWDVGWRCDLGSLNSSDAIAEASPDLLMHVIAVGDDRAPIWPSGFVGSISHSPNWTWAVAAPQSKLLSIGIDTEAIISVDTHEVVRQEIASPSEWALLKAHSLRPELESTLMFSVKEAYFKLWYPLARQFYNFEDVVVFDVSAEQKIPKNLADHSHLSFDLRTKGESADSLVRTDQSSLTRVNVVWTKTDVFSAAWLAARGD